MKSFFNTLTGVAVGLAMAISAAFAETANVSMMLTNDLDQMGTSGERGGFARLASVVKAERAKGGNVLFIHAGDAISPSLMSGFDSGEHIMVLNNMLKPDLFVPGNHEYDFGEEIFRKRMAEADFPLFAANLRDADGNVLEGFKDTAMMEFGPAKIGFVGLTADDAYVKSSPGSLKIAPTVETGVEQARMLREQGADLVVAVTHANVATDYELYNSGAFDVVLTGDDHDLRVVYNGKTAMMESSEQGNYVAIIDLAIDVTEKDGRRTVSWHPGFRIIDSATVEPDAAMAAKVKAYEDLLSNELDVEIGETATPLDSRRATVRGGEAAIGNLIADAMKAAVGADIAITNGGGIRANKEYAPGTKLTRRDVLSELPFGNKTLLLEISGKDVLAALENGVSAVEDGGGRFPQVSGLTAEFDLSKPKGERVGAVTVNGAPLDPTATYRLATNDFMARGGDGYSSLTNAKVVLGDADGKLMANDVMAYVKRMGAVSPKVEGRMKAM